jgi:hypothetical protein
VAFAFQRSKNSGCVIKDYSAEPQCHHKQVRSRYPRRIQAAEYPHVDSWSRIRGTPLALHVCKRSVLA